MAVAVDLLDAVEEAGNHIVAAGSLTAGQDDADVDGLVLTGVRVFLKPQFGHAVRVGEQCFYLGLIGYRFRGLAFHSLYGTGEHYRQFGLIRSAGFLKCTLFHELYITVVNN